MKTTLSRLSMLLVVLVAGVGSLTAQTSTADKFVISAKAGGVNAVVGDVRIHRATGRYGRLFKGDEVQIGEKVTTGTDGKVEVLMNPGSYVRLGADSSFEFESTNLDDLRIKMLRGSAIFEVFGAEDFTAKVTAGNSKFSLIDTGVYRVALAANGNATIYVIKGKAEVDGANNKPLSSGRMAAFNGSDYVVSKFDKDEKDELSQWSKSRAKELSNISASLKRDRLRDPLINSFYGGHWNLFNSFGLWVYDPFYRSFCFLPFGYGWYSPYGFNYGRPIWYYRLPRSIYAVPAPSDRTGQGPLVKVDPNRGRVLVKSDQGSAMSRGDNGRIRVKEPDRKPVEPVFNPPSISLPRVSVPVVTDTKPSGKRP